MSYKIEIATLLKKELAREDQIFDYEDTPLEPLCNNLFLYYKKLIENNSDIYNINPSFFFFNSNRNVNAWAKTQEGNSIVSINIGTVNQLKNIFLANEELVTDIFGTDVQKLNDILKEKNSSLFSFMFHSSIIFLMNHETCHLIQNSDKKEKSINETTHKISDFIIDNHVYEIDADVFASMKLSQDIYKIWNGFDDKYRNDAFLGDLISLAVSAIGIFKLFNLQAENNFYYKLKSHPHVVVRYIIVLETMLDYTSHLRNRKISETFKDATLNNSFDYIEILNRFQKDSFFENFAALSIKYSKGIRKYSNYLLSQISLNPNCAYYKLKHFKI